MHSYDEHFEGLYRLAYRIAYRLLGNREAAEDIAQEALARALVHWWRVQRFADPSAWVARVAANLVIGSWRRQHRVAPETVPHQWDATENAGMRIDLQRALRQLPRRQREVVVLRFVADFSERDAAHALGCSEGTVKQHATRGLAALRRRLDYIPSEGVTDVRASR